MSPHTWPALLLAVAVAASGCDAATDVDPRGGATRLVVFGTFAPSQARWRVEVDRTRGFGDTPTPPVTDAVVTVALESGGEPLRLTLAEDGAYEGDGLQPVAGKRYRLRVEVPGLPVATAVSEVPEPAAGFAVALSAPPLSPPGARAELTPTFRDGGGRRDFYRLRVVRLAGGEINVRFSGQHPAFPRTQFEDAASGPGRPFEGGVVFDDRAFDGRAFRAVLLASREPTHAYGVRLTRLSEALYRHLRTREALDDADRDDNVLAEPVIPFSNVEGGVGTFAGYAEQEAFVVVGDITPALVAGTYDAVSLLDASGEIGRDLIREGARLVLTLRADGTAEGTRMWPAQGGSQTDAFAGTFRLDEGRVTLDVQPALDPAFPYFSYYQDGMLAAQVGRVFLTMKRRG